MALSAFGVDHGEISKAIPGMGLVSGLGAKAGGAVSSAGSKTGAFKTKNFKVKSGIGQKVGSVGSGLSRAGAKMSANPGRTGGAILGGGALGTGGIAMAGNGRRNR